MCFTFIYFLVDLIRIQFYIFSGLMHPEPLHSSVIEATHCQFDINIYRFIVKHIRIVLTNYIHSFSCETFSDEILSRKKILINVHDIKILFIKKTFNYFLNIF